MRSVYFQVVANTGPRCRAQTRENTKFGHRFTGKHQIPTKSPSGGQIYLPMNSRNGQSLPLAMETLEPVGEERRQQHTRSFIALSADSSEQWRICTISLYLNRTPRKFAPSAIHAHLTTCMPTACLSMQFSNAKPVEPYGIETAMRQETCSISQSMQQRMKTMFPPYLNERKNDTRLCMLASTSSIPYVSQV